MNDIDKDKTGPLAEEGLIKASIHSLVQKFGRSQVPGQLSIFDQIEDRKLVEKAKDFNIKTIGWDLTRAEDQAVFAIQKIYAKYGYRGNVKNNDNSLVFTHSEYYENYGVKKYKYDNKERFSDSGKEQACNALLNLRSKRCIMIYEELDLAATKKCGEKIFDRFETDSNILYEIDWAYKGLTKKEKDDLDNEKHRSNKLLLIKVLPSKVFLSQIGNFYALLPSNFYTDIKEKFPRVKNIHLPLFIQWLSFKVALIRRKNLDNILIISFERLSDRLRMESWIKSRQKKRVDDRLVDCFKQAKILGYLKDYKIIRGKTVSKKAKLYININKFKSRKQVEEIVFDSNPEEEYIYKPRSKEVNKEIYKRLAKFSPKYREKLKDIEEEF